MGKPIAVISAAIVGEVAVFDTDRSITGQDGTGFDSADAASAAGDSLPGRLSARLFEAIPGLSHAFVASSQVVLRRTGGWDDATHAVAGEVIGRFFVFYP